MFTSLGSLPSARRPRAGFSLRAMLALARQRHQLAQLDDDRLADLGLTRHEAQAEARRPFWDAPANWTK